MVRKHIRKKGKIGLSKYFKKFNDGESVAIVKEKGVRASFPIRIIGQSGKIIGSRGSCKLVEIKDGNKKKTFIILPVHLKKLKS